MPTLSKRFAALDIPSKPRAGGTSGAALTAPGAAEALSGVILYDETLRQQSAEGEPIASLCGRLGILPGIKVDLGAKPMAGTDGERVTEGLDGLRDRLAEYRELGARFAKWRAVLDVGEGRPSARCVTANAHALARYAALCQEQGVVPIVEPEVLMDGRHGVERCEEVTGRVLQAVFAALFEQGSCSRHAAEAEHGRLRKDCPRQAPSGGGRRDTALPAPSRAGGGRRRGLPVRGQNDVLATRTSTPSTARKAEALEAPFS